jgi:hypothetical protein
VETKTFQTEGQSERKHSTDSDEKDEGDLQVVDDLSTQTATGCTTSEEEGDDPLGQEVLSFQIL